MAIIDMEKLYQKPSVEWEELYLYSILCDSKIDGDLEDLTDEPLY